MCLYHLPLHRMFQVIESLTKPDTSILHFHSQQLLLFLCCTPGCTPQSRASQDQYGTPDVDIATWIDGSRPELYAYLAVHLSYFPTVAPALHFTLPMVTLLLKVSVNQVCVQPIKHPCFWCLRDCLCN